MAYKIEKLQLQNFGMIKSFHCNQFSKERNSLYEKQNDLKGQKWKIEKSLER